MKQIIVFGSLFLLGLLLSALLYKRAKRLWLFVGVLVVVASLLAYGPYKNETDRWLFEKLMMTVASVDSGNQFTVIGSFKRKRQLLLANTKLPSSPTVATQAKQMLAAFIKESGIEISFITNNSNELEPWPVTVKKGELNINKLMVEKGYLEAADRAETAAPAPPVERVPEVASIQQSSLVKSAKSAQPTTDRFKFEFSYRLLIWVFAGIFGAVGFGMVLAGYTQGFIVPLIVVSSAIYSVITSWKEGTSIAPPLITISLIILLSGAGKKAYLQRLEKSGDS